MFRRSHPESDFILSTFNNMVRMAKRCHYTLNNYQMTEQKFLSSIKFLEL